MAERRIIGTNEVWNGLVVKLGDFEYTTVGGGIEGDRQQLEPIQDSTNDTVETRNNNLGTPPDTLGSNSNDENPVTDLFVRGDGSSFDRVYYYSNGDMVENGVELHRHQDGTIMTQHSMGPNDNSVVVTANRPMSGQTSNQNTNQGNMGGGGSY